MKYGDRLMVSLQTIINQNNFTLQSMPVKYIFIFCLNICIWQSSILAQTDTSTLSLDNFLQLVKKNHPVAKQADLVIENADANRLSAAGGFDPKLYYSFKNKFYDADNYYKLADGGFSIPTWFGIDLKAGYEMNSGQYLNPENTMPDAGLFYAQISLPLLQGLLIDERRATLKQAELFQGLSEFEKIQILNELLYKAGKAYWDWQLAYANMITMQNAVELSRQRFNAIIISAELGDRPAIDTVEANIQLQDRLLNLQQMELEYRTQSLMLSNYLWLENNVPIELTNAVVPETYSENAILVDSTYLNIGAIDSLISVHPNLQVYDFKLQQLEIERKFKQDKLKPTLNLNYNPLFDADNFNANNFQNYKWGISAGFPLFLRKERGDLQLTKIKIENTTYETMLKRNELTNKTKAVINAYANYREQTALYTANVRNYENLWRSEQRLFDVGESSLFMINSREMSYINAQIKLNEIVNKNKKAALDVEYAFGQLSTLY